MSDKKPIPLVNPIIQPRPVGAVCGKVSYSLGGVHPQCAQENADAQRVQDLKQAMKAEKVTPPEPLSQWHKLCPKCRQKLHVRKLRCDCGHQFAEASESGRASGPRPR